MKRVPLLAAALALAACEWKPDRPPLDLSSAFTPEAPASPTPTPLAEGIWRLSSTEAPADEPEESATATAVATTGDAVAMTATTAADAAPAAPSPTPSERRCTPSLPARVILAGERGWYQLTGTGLADAQGRFDGAQLSLEAKKIRNARPMRDCVSETTERWTLLRETPDADALAGVFVVETSPVEGRGCEERCGGRLDVRLEFLSAKAEKTATPTPEPEPEPSPSLSPSPSPSPAGKKKKTTPAKKKTR